MKVFSDEFARALEDRIEDCILIVGIPFFSFLIGGCAVGAVELAQRDTANSEPNPTIYFPACGEEDNANVTLVEMPVGVSNEDVGNYICYVRVVEEGQQNLENPKDRIELRLKE